MDERIEQPQEQSSIFDELGPTHKPGFVPIPSNVQDEPEGNIFMMELRDSTEWGAFMNTGTASVTDKEPEKDYNFLAYVPENYTDYADRYALTKNSSEAQQITGRLDQEFADDALRQAHPWKSLAYGAVAQAISPSNYLVGTALFSNLKKSSSLMKTLTATAVANAASAGIQEAVLQQSQLSREAMESTMNVFSAGILGGALGGIGYGIGKALGKSELEIKESYGRAKQDIHDTLVDTPKTLTDKGTLKEEDLAHLPETGNLSRKAMDFTPMNRLLNSPFSSSKYFANTFFEHNYTLNKHLKGDTQGASVETLIKTRKQEFAVKQLDYQDIYFKMAGIDSGPFKGTRAKLNKPELSWEEFDQRTSRVVYTGAADPIPAVNEGAAFLQREFFEPLKNEMIAEGFLPKDVSVKNAANYFTIAFNRDKIIEQGGRSARRENVGFETFPDALYDGFKAVEEKIKVLKESPAFKNIEKELMPLKESLRIAERDKIKEEIKPLKEKVIELETRIRELGDDDMFNSSGEFFRELTDEERWQSVEQTVDKILGDQDAKLLNPFMRLLEPRTNVTQERAIKIQQEKLSEWHITSGAKVAEMYTRAVIPMLEMKKAAKRFGAESIPEMREKISESLSQEFKEQSKGLTGKAAQDLRKKRDANIADMNATLDLLQGVYGDGPNVMSAGAAKYYRNFMKWNAIRLLGHMTLSSIPDLGIQVIANGPYKTIHDGILPMLRGMSGLSKSDARAIGFGVESELGTRMKSFADHESLTSNPGVFQKGFDKLSDGFGNATLMNQWNSMQQNIASRVSINRTINTIIKSIEGKKVAAKDMERLARLGIDKKHFETIKKFTEGNFDEDTKTYYADWTNWDISTPQEAEALRQFKAATVKDVDSIVVKPGLGDRPLRSQTPVGKMIFQFKSFLMAATNRVLIPSVQRHRDIDVWLGTVSMLALGAVSYVATSVAKGREPDLSFGNLAKESIDRSGLLGVYMEVYNIAEKGLGGQGVSRYQSRDFAGAFTGPTGGAINEIQKTFSKLIHSTAGEEDFNTKDAEKLMRLMPFQNLFYLNQLTKAFAQNVAVQLGADDVRD